MDSGQVRAASVSIETRTGEAARSLAPVVCGLYEAGFSLPPFNGDAAEFTSQQAYYPTLTERPGVRLTTARVGDEYVGFGYGYLLPADTRWWKGLAEPVSDEVTRETGHRTFAVIDYGVLPSWRGHGVGRAIHDELLGGSGAERATLSVQPKAEETQAIYRRWGWRKVSSIEMDPPIPAPVFDILVLDALPPLTR
jgi:ribosomal protein S18 acetylase RimI-like enzyme